ncbi:hypothetical protein BJ138DRAFT_1018848, partial [Hygrophoropsis aurantiaca]
RYIQLLRVGWYPATTDRPQTVFTFDVLETFHDMTLQAKTPAFDFYTTMVHKTDGSGVVNIQNRYMEFSRVMRQWRHLQSLKRADRGHDPSGIEATRQGELAVECPACPHPGKNIPDDWKAAPKHLAYLYALYLSMDANFRCPLKDRKLKDIELAPGWGVLVEETGLQAIVEQFGDRTEPSTCQVEHDAIVRANTRNKEGYIVSGTGAAMCARHILVRPNGVADLQKGERYCNMDYILLSTLVGVNCLLLFLTYDIACQYHKRLETRIQEFPPNMQLDTTRLEMRYAVPKYHLKNQGSDCQINFSLNLITGSGRTCGEGIETAWAHMNGVGTSTREMSPGGRHKVLNDHWSAWNWKKIVGFGPGLLSKLRKAVAMHAKHQDILERYTTTFPVSTIRDWEHRIEVWENDMTQPNPYEEPQIHTTQADIRLQLAEEETVDVRRGIVPLHDISPSVFLHVGLELEEQQHVLNTQATSLRGKGTSTQQALVQEKRNTLRRKLEQWREVQRTYMPVVAQLHELTVNAEESTPDKAEMLKLWLPSSLPAHITHTVTIADLRKKELRFRFAQAEDSLADVRHYRRICQSMFQFKKSNISGTENRANTRAHAVIDRFRDKALHSADRYNRARKALLNLDPHGSWINRLLELKKDDVRGPGRDDKRESEGRYIPSWIWMVPGAAQPVDSGSGHVLNESIRVEWAKSRARTERWQEEKYLVAEEMRRVLAYFNYKSTWWREQAVRRNSHISSSLRNGLSAYAHKQAAVFGALGKKFTKQWIATLKASGLPPVWESRFELLLSEPAPVAI